MTPTEQQQSAYHERIRRDLVLCNAYGAQSGLMTIRARLHGQSGVPKWLAKALKEVADRVDKLPPELVDHRNEVSYDYTL